MKKITLILISLAFLASCKSNKVIPTADETVTEARQERRTNQRGQTPPSADELIAQMDTNKDGQLAKTEIKGRLLERFDTIDTDKNGFLSKEEIENAPKPQRGQRPQRNG